MASKATVKSIEPNIADLANGWLRSYRLDYKLEQESLNTELIQLSTITYQRMVVLVEIAPMQSFYFKTKL